MTTDDARPVLWIVTGAAGFLGNVLVRELVTRGERVHAIVHGSLTPPSLAGVPCERSRAELTDAASLVAAFAHDPEERAIVVHTAGRISISSTDAAELRAVNVEGTRNVITAARTTGVDRLVDVSSVHALPEPSDGSPIREDEDYEPASVVGDYAKSKAEASRLVVAALDLDPVLVHPTGLIGPGDPNDGHLTKLVRDALTGRLPAVVPGGYDFVDVRDVASGTIAAALHGRTGRSYLLGGHWAEVRDVVRSVARAAHRRTPLRIPMALARLAAPIAEAIAAKRGTRPLVTPYSLHTLASGIRVDHGRAAEELGYTARPLAESLHDTVEWLRVYTHPPVTPPAKPTRTPKRTPRARSSTRGRSASR